MKLSCTVGCLCGEITDEEIWRTGNNYRSKELSSEGHPMELSNAVTFNLTVF